MLISLKQWKSAHARFHAFIIALRILLVTLLNLADFQEVIDCHVDVIELRTKLHF
jgi:hypothetical protein